MPEPHEPQAQEDGVAPAACAPHEIEPARSAISPALPWHSWTAWRGWMLRAVAIVALWQVLIVAAIVSEQNSSPISFAQVAGIIRRTFTVYDLGPGGLLWVMLAFTALAMKPGATAPRDRAGFVTICTVLPVLPVLYGLSCLSVRPIALWHWITLRGTDQDYLIAACLIGPLMWLWICWRPLREAERISNAAHTEKRLAQECERLRLARERQVCQACAYNLAGLPASSVCPECGADQTG